MTCFRAEVEAPHASAWPAPQRHPHGINRWHAWGWLVSLGLAAIPLGAQEPPDTNYDETRVPSYTLPELLRSDDGRPVTTAEFWRAVRRPELLEAFAAHVYGRTPPLPFRVEGEEMETDPQALGGQATRKQVRLRLFADPAAPWMDLLLYLPNTAPHPVPVFLGLSYGNQGVNVDPGIRPSRDTTPSRGAHAHRWPLELILSRGYGVVTFAGADVEQDRHGSGSLQRPDGWKTGIRGYALAQSGRGELAEDAWGSLGAWAWGLSRALDYLERDPAVDARRVTVFGHSRTGKAALWAAAQDERFALAISNNSGQGGAALARRRYSESVAASVALSGIWYSRRYAQYAHREADLPVDAHALIALIAPRPVYVASAVEDRWADPRGEFLAARHAKPVYQLFGLPGLGVEDLPPLNQSVGGTIGYHLRSGDHEITPFDWQQFLDFADRHLRPSLPASPAVKAVSRAPSAPAAPFLDASAARDVSGELDPIRTRFRLPALACAVVRSNRLVGTGCVGVRKQGEVAPVTFTDRWHHGSVTKSMTATLAGRLVEQGYLSWSTCLGEVFAAQAEAMHPDWRQVTLEQLLAHRGGAPGDLRPGGLWDRLWRHPGNPREQRRFLVQEITAVPPVVPPGTAYLYSNAGFTLAGAMLEEVTDRAWEDLIREHLFRPLGMHGGGFGPPAAPGQVNQPWGHVFDQDTPVPIAPGPQADNPAGIGPAGTVHSTLPDLAAYLAVHLAGARGRSEYLTADTFRKLHTDVAGQGYALGWVVGSRSWAGGRTLSHTGSNTQWYTNVWLAPEKDFAMIIVTNIGGDRAFEATDAVASRLVALFLEP